MRKSATHEFTRRNVRLPDSIWTSIMLIAAKTSRDIGEVVMDALEGYTRVEMLRLFGKQKEQK